MEETQPPATSSRFFQYLATVAIALYTLTCGLGYGWSSPSLIKLRTANSEVHITSDQGSWLTESLLFGSIIGGCFFGVGLRNFGRKTAALITGILFVLSWSLLAFANSFPMLVAARVLLGIPDALVYCNLPLYLGEVSDRKIRGALFCCTTVAQTFGYLLMNIIGTYLSIRQAALTVTALPIIALLIFLWLPESPYYLILNGRFELAKRSLEVFKGSENVDEQFDNIRKSIEDVQVASANRYSDLFRVPSNRKAFLIVCMVTTVEEMSGYMAINFYAQTIFENIYSGTPASDWASLYFVLQMMFTGVNALLVDRAGRKPLMIISTLGSFITLSTLSVVFYLHSIHMIIENIFAMSTLVPIMAFVIVFNLGLPSMPLLLLAEMFPTNVKSYAVSTHELYSCASNLVVAKLFYLTKENYGIHLPFLIFAISSLLGCFFVMFLVPETKRKSLEEVHDMLRK